MIFRSGADDLNFKGHPLPKLGYRRTLVIHKINFFLQNPQQLFHYFRRIYLFKRAKANNRNDVSSVVNKLWYGDWFLLMQLSKHYDPGKICPFLFRYGALYLFLDCLVKVYTQRYQNYNYLTKTSHLVTLKLKYSCNDNIMLYSEFISKQFEFQQFLEKSGNYQMGNPSRQKIRIFNLEGLREVEKRKEK